MHFEPLNLTGSVVYGVVRGLAMSLKFKTEFLFLCASCISLGKLSGLCLINPYFTRSLCERNNVCKVRAHATLPRNSVLFLSEWVSPYSGFPRREITSDFHRDPYRARKPAQAFSTRLPIFKTEILTSIRKQNFENQQQMHLAYSSNSAHNNLSKCFLKLNR